MAMIGWLAGCAAGPLGQVPVVESGSRQEAAPPAPVTAPAGEQENTAGSPASVPQNQTRPEYSENARVVPGRPPAVVALLDSAMRQQAGDDLNAAAASLERAIRIAPRDPELYLELARVRAGQQDQAQAQQLCRKAISLAGSDASIRLRCERLLRAAG